MSYKENLFMRSAETYKKIREERKRAIAAMTPEQRARLQANLDAKQLARQNALIEALLRF